jgi:predicted ATPase/DNA-binding CsgD family transcriptional regulator
VSEARSATSAPPRLRSVPIERGSSDARAIAPLWDLPQPLTSLIGRDAEVAAVRALLLESGVRLMTLTGLGGVGKTRLALRVAEDVAAAFSDGVVFVPLAAIADPDLVLPTIARALSLRETRSQTPLDAVAGFLRQRELLLVLDNIEQVRAAAPSVAELLARCYDLVILVTSRIPLHVSGEQRFPVTPLAIEPANRQVGASASRSDRHYPSPITRTPSPAVQLFVARARAIDPSFALDDGKADAIAAICRHLDGLPLAIELAAARIQMLSLRELRDRLDRALPYLGDGPVDAPDRLRTMRDAIAWSYEFLSPGERTLFRRLAVFAGGFTLEAAAWMSASTRHPTPDTFHRVSALLDHSLLRRTEQSDGESRFTMLETVREYGLDELTASGDEAAARGTHAAYFLQLAERAEPDLLAGDKAVWVSRLTAELPNLRAAFAWWRARNDADRALRLAGSLGLFWTEPSFVREGRAWLEAAVALPQADRAPAPLAKALNAIGIVAQWQCDFARVAAALTAALAIRQELRDELGVAEVLGNLGHLALAMGDLERAAALLTDSLPLYERAGRTAWVGETLMLLGHTVRALGEYDRSAGYHQEAVEIFRRLPSQGKLADGLLNLGWAQLLRGDLVQARSAYAEGFALVRSQGDAMRLGRCVRGAAGLAAVEGPPLRAARLFAAAAAQRDREEIALQPVIQADHDRLVASIRAMLGEATFAAAWSDGYALTLDIAGEEAATVFAGPVKRDKTEPPGVAENLTPREREILSLLVEGQSDREIAAAFGISRYTVSQHVATIRGKLDAPSRAAAAAIAVRNGLVAS